MTTQQTNPQSPASPTPASDFIRSVVREDLENGRFQGRVITRFPPEPNGYLHIGHAKSALLNFSIAKDHGGLCHLRFDDTNPTREEEEYVSSIQKDLRWLGLDWGEHLYYASDYFEKMYRYATHLIETGHAYVCDLTQDQIREYRGTFTEPGKPSPFRERSVEDNLDLLRRMRAGEFEDGSRVLRAKIDMASGNLNLRDPVLYRILNVPHQRTRDRWCIFPTYDFAHGQSDSIEGVTHSICTLEFEDHRPLYDWFIDRLGIHHPQQIEFARLNLSHTIMSKRKLLELVNQGYVTGWTTPGCQLYQACEDADLPRKPFEPSANELEWQKGKTPLKSRCLNTVFGRTSIEGRGESWLYLIRFASS